jgi:hypothetical protein
MRTLFVVIAGFIAAATSAFASTDDSWSDLERRAVPACTLTTAKFALTADLQLDGRILGVGGDSDQYYGLVFVDDKRQRWLCLYDKKTGAKTVSHIEDVGHR